MTDYATMVLAGVRDRPVSGRVFLTASANWHRYQRQKAVRSCFIAPPELLTQVDT
jgi:hypothetical protein